MTKRKRKFTPLQITAHMGSWIPLALLALNFWRGNLGPDIIREATLRTGKAALVLLVLSLACTPVNILFRYRPVLKLRRPLGLYSFIGVDYFFNFALIKGALFEKRYALVGFATGLILLALAITSTDVSKRRLRKNWTHLHKLAYAAGMLAVVHFIWLVKQGVLEPWIWALVIAFLLLLRVKPVKQFVTDRSQQVSRLQRKITQSVKVSLQPQQK